MLQPRGPSGWQPTNWPTPGGLDDAGEGGGGNEAGADDERAAPADDEGLAELGADCPEQGHGAAAASVSRSSRGSWPPAPGLLAGQTGAPTLLAGEVLRDRLSEIVLSSPAAPDREDQRAALAPLLDAFFEGLGSKATEVLSANLDRGSARLVQLVEAEQRRFMAKPATTS